MEERRKFHRPPTNVVYEVDGSTYGLDDGLVEALKTSIRRRLESKTLDIPRLPQVAARILELSQNPDTNIDDIAETILTDPLMATRILAIANSAAYGGGSRIDSLQSALMRLGSKIVKDTVFAESIRMKIFSSKSYRPILEQSWKLSLGTAIACEAVSRETGVERDSSFLIGLLHETGTAVLVSAVTEHERQNGGKSLGLEVVEILISQLHEETGAHVLAEWGMTPAVVAAAREHHRYRGAGKNPPACALVYAANLICQHLGIGSEPRNVDFTVEHVFADLQLADRDRIEALLAKVASEVGGMMSGLQHS